MKNKIEILRDFKKEGGIGYFGLIGKNKKVIEISNGILEYRFVLPNVKDCLNKNLSISDNYIWDGFLISMLKFDKNTWNNNIENWDIIICEKFEKSYKELFTKNYYKELAFYYDKENEVFLEYSLIIAYYYCFSGDKKGGVKLMKDFCKWLCDNNLLEKKNIS